MISTVDRPLRSALYVPGSNPRAVKKAADLPVDAVILDLEDAVAPDRKDAAREAVTAALAEGGPGGRYRMVRVNGADTPWGAADLAACAAARPDAVVVPKVDGPADLAAAARALPPGVAVWAMMETAAAVADAVAVARAPRLAGLVMGTNDLARALGCRERADRIPLMGALQACVLAARVAGVPCLDGAFMALDDAEGLRAECEQGRDLGMDGKTLIHPGQIAAANAAFGPTGAEVERAHRVIAAFEAASSRGEGVAVLDGRLVEGLHVDMARRTLARWQAIAAREGT